MSKTKAFIERLKSRWGITSTWQVIIILIVFACTGFTTLYVEELIYKLFHIPEENRWWIAVLLFIFITIPLYNLILLVYGFIFGQFRFFWNFEKRFFGRIIHLFHRKQFAIVNNANQGLNPYLGTCCYYLIAGYTRSYLCYIPTGFTLAYPMTYDYRLQILLISEAEKIFN